LLWSPEFVGQPGAQAWLEDLAVLVGAANRSFDIRNLLTDVELVRDMGRARAILSGLGRGLQQSGNSLRDVLARPEYQFLGKYSWERASQVAQGDGDPGERIEAIRLLGLGPIDRALAVLPPLLDARQPGEVQLAALQALGAIPDRRVGPLVVGRWKELGPAGRREAAEVLFARADRVAALLDAVEAKQIAPADLDPGRRQQLLSLPEAAVRQRAAALFGAAGTGSDRARVIAEYRQALDLGGDSARGRLVFAKTCAACHKAEGRGADVGPDLATVVGRTPEDLLIQILDPNREVPPAYLNYTVATTDGRVLSGLIAGETAGALTLKRAEGLTDVVPRDRIEAVASSGLSLMPEGLEQGLDSQAMADLIAFLRGLGSPGVPGGR
jgi:putative heme-binding domain-containing protein